MLNVTGTTAAARPFASQETVSPPGLSEKGGAVHLAVGALTDTGRVREHNQDALFALSGVLSQGDELLPLGLCIVADGTGGDAGAQASALAVRLVADWILDRIYRPFLREAERPAERQPIHQVLRDAVVAAHERLQQACPGGRTTCTCAFILGTNAFVAHVGDSRAYVVQQGEIELITTDHSLVNRLIQVGQITPQEAKTHPQRNVLYRALGGRDPLEVDTLLQPLPVGSVLLLCSDGLWGTLSQEAVLSVVRTAPSLQVACHRLVAQANENGGEDNISVLLVQVRD